MTFPNFKSSWFLVFLAVILTSSIASAGQITFISTDQLKDEMAKSDVIVIDVRVAPEWDSSQTKIRGALRESPAEVDKWMPKYSRDKTIVLYCD
jgi:rhodanese-related sulfurtransferase